jgi:hypothetical protein
MQNSQLDRIWILHPKGIYFSFTKIIASKKHQIVHSLLTNARLWLVHNNDPIEI